MTAPSSDGSPASAVAAAIEAWRLTKNFGRVTALDGVDLTVCGGEVVAVLGPSGCGKTTLLRLVAGFERPDAGVLRLQGKPVAGEGTFLPPHRRRVGMVFQDYALFPHLTVGANVAYGLGGNPRRRASAPPVRAALDMVGLAGFDGRYPAELSGGQQQRVALARALVPNPTVVLLDEPFSNLDVGLRSRVRAEVMGILRGAGATAVLVTHDQEEALAVADRVAVLHHGKVLQVGPPAQLYEHPADPFVASFVGQASLLPAVVKGGVALTAIGPVHLSRTLPDGPAQVALRPEALGVQADPDGPATVASAQFLGADEALELVLEDGTKLRCRQRGPIPVAVGQRVRLEIRSPVPAFPAPPPPRTPSEKASL